MEWQLTIQMVAIALSMSGLYVSVAMSFVSNR